MGLDEETEREDERMTKRVRQELMKDVCRIEELLAWVGEDVIVALPTGNAVSEALNDARRDVRKAIRALHETEAEDE